MVKIYIFISKQYKSNGFACVSIFCLLHPENACNCVLKMAHGILWPILRLPCKKKVTDRLTVTKTDWFGLSYTSSATFSSCSIGRLIWDIQPVGSVTFYSQELATYETSTTLFIDCVFVVPGKISGIKITVKQKYKYVLESKGKEKTTTNRRFVSWTEAMRMDEIERFRFLHFYFVDVPHWKTTYSRKMYKLQNLPIPYCLDAPLTDSSAIPLGLVKPWPIQCWIIDLKKLMMVRRSVCVV